MSRPRAFVEAPAGLAAVSLRLHGGEYCRPPISRMGAKTGFAAVILAALGLRSGQGADAYVFAESDPDVRALLRAYPDPAMLRRIAEIIRGWKDEEPRALWERLRAERKARGPAGDDVPAGWIVGSAWTKQNDPDGSMYMGPDRPSACHEPGWVASVTLDGLTDRCHRLAEYASIVASNRLIHVAGPDLRNTGAGGTTFGGEAFATPAAEVASGFERVAGWSTLTAWTKQNDPNGSMYMGPDRPSACHEPGWVASITTDGLGRRYNNLASRWPPVAVLATLPDAAELSALLGTPGDLEGVVILSDPPYENTTSYAHSLPRADVVRLALDWSAAGAVVCVCEQEPIPALVDAGWHASRITDGRRGQRRTFSRQSEEYLTMSIRPAHVVAKQISMFTA